MPKLCPNITFPHQQDFFPIRSVTKSSTARFSHENLVEKFKIFVQDFVPIRTALRDQNNSNSNMIIAMHVSLARFSTMEQTVVRPEPNAAGSTDTLDIPPTLAVEETGNSAA